MWVPKIIAEYLQVSKAVVDDLRVELAAARAERDALKLQAAVNQTHFDWLRTKINQLEQERAGLIEKAYQIKLPAVPELVRTPAAPFSPPDFSFNDIGDELARVMQMPLHDPTKN